MFDDQVLYIAKPVSSGACSKAPVHVFSYTVPEWPHGIENFTPYNHIGSNRETYPVYVTFTIKRENHFECFDRIRTERVLTGNDNVAADKIVSLNCSNPFLDPVEIGQTV
jgi:hypothetical protein